MIDEHISLQQWNYVPTKLNPADLASRGVALTKLSDRRARQRCFWLLAFISRRQVRNIHLPGRMILPGSLILSDKYFLKNLTFVVRNPLVWLRHHSSQTLYVARVKSKQLKKQCPSWPTAREVMTTSSCWVRGYYSTPSPTVQSTPVNRIVERDSAVSGY